MMKTEAHRPGRFAAGVASGLLLLGWPALARADEPLRLHAEVDPLPFARGGYGGQLGLRPGTKGLRFALASFSLDVPDFAVQLRGNDGFHARVRPSAALYALYYLAPRHDGFAAGGALRYLRLTYEHDDFPENHADVSELSPELIAAFKWHPWRAGFYLQPWIGLSTTLWRTNDAVVGDRTYRPIPVQAFFTVNLGWELIP